MIRTYIFMIQLICHNFGDARIQRYYMYTQQMFIFIVQALHNVFQSTNFWQSQNILMSLKNLNDSFLSTFSS